MNILEGPRQIITRKEMTHDESHHSSLVTQGQSLMRSDFPIQICIVKDLYMLLMQDES